MTETPSINIFSIDPNKLVRKLDIRGENGKRSEKERRFLMQELKGLTPEEQIKLIQQRYKGDPALAKFGLE